MKISTTFLLLTINITLTLLNINSCTPLNQTEKTSCYDSEIFPKVFKKHHKFSGPPINTKDTEVCKDLTEKCCLQTEVDELMNYWEISNATNQYSSDQRNFADMVYDIYYVYPKSFIDLANHLSHKNNVMKHDTDKEAIKYVQSLKKGDNPLLKKFRKTSKKCWQINATMLKGLMCSFCSPEQKDRIRSNNIFFDAIEAAAFSRGCKDYFLYLPEMHKHFQAVWEVVKYGWSGNLRDADKKLDFLSFMNSHADYKPENIEENMDNCKFIDGKDIRDIDFTNISPEKGCKKVVERYMTIGALVKFDQQIRNDLISLTTL